MRQALWCQSAKVNNCDNWLEEAGNSNGAVSVPNEQVETNETTKDIAEVISEPVVEDTVKTTSDI